MKTRLLIIIGIIAAAIIILPNFSLEEMDSMILWCNQWVFSDSRTCKPLWIESEPKDAPLDDYHLDEPFEIKMDQRIQFDDLELYFYDIEDSRCPLDVTCVWEGKVTVMINIKNQTHKVGGMFPPGYTISYFSPYEITLVDIQPHPISTEAAEYVATIKISNLLE